MQTYLISYDLAEPATIKNLMTSEIMDLGSAWARPLANCWYLRTKEPQAEIEARLRDHLDIDDGLLIQPVRDDAVMMNTGLRWFRQRRRDDPGANAATLAETPSVETNVVETNVIAFPRIGPAPVHSEPPQFAKAG